MAEGKWDWTIYVFDSEVDRLVPIWPHEPESAQAALVSFAPGNGASGQAWSNEQVVVRVGEEVADATHGLTREQQDHFANRRSVVATPIWADDSKIGVLAGICDDEDRQFEREADRSHVQTTATIIGTLIESLRSDL